MVIEPPFMAVVQASLSTADQPPSTAVQTAAPIVETALDTELVPASPHTNCTIMTSGLDLSPTCPGPSTNVTISAPSLISVSEACYPKFIMPEILAHLSDVKGVEGWSNLVQMYLKFETISPSKSIRLLFMSFFAMADHDADSMPPPQAMTG